MMNNEGELKSQGNRDKSIGQGNYNENIGRDYIDKSTKYHYQIKLNDEITDTANNLAVTSSSKLIN